MTNDVKAALDELGRRALPADEAARAVTWADVDAWKATNAALPHRRIAHPGRVVFAERPGFEVSGDRVAGSIAIPAARFVSWPSGDEVLSLRPCFHVPRKWRSHYRARVSWLRAHAEKGGRWEGVDVRELLVALDAWLEAGCPRRKWKRLEVFSVLDGNLHSPKMTARLIHSFIR